MILLLARPLVGTTAETLPEATPSVGNQIHRREVFEDGTTGPEIILTIPGTQTPITVNPGTAVLFGDKTVGADPRSYQYRIESRGANNTSTLSPWTG